MSLLVSFMDHVLQCIVKGLRNDRLENPLAFYNLCALVGMASQDRGDVSLWMLGSPHPYASFSCKDGRDTGWGKGKQNKGNLGLSGTG